MVFFTVSSAIPGICIVGCGSIARLHARNLKAVARLYYTSRTLASAQKLQRKFGGQVVDTFEAVLECPDIDALVIASPVVCHTQQVVAGLGAAKDILVEKPLCPVPTEMEHIAEALTSQPGRFLMVAENYYYRPSLLLMQDFIERGYIGEIRQVTVRKHLKKEVKGWRRTNGALLEGGIHFIALISALFHTAPKVVTAEFPGYGGYGQATPERNSIVRLNYGQAEAELRYAWDRPSMTRGLLQHSRVIGTLGDITFESNGLYVRLRSPKRRGVFFPCLGDLMGYHGMIRDFIACLGDRQRQPVSDFERARRDLQIVFDAYEALKE